MSCPSSVMLSTYADGELATKDARWVERHAASCAACHARIAALRDEAAALRSALRSVEDSAPMPKFARPPRARDFVALVLGTGLVAGFANAFWSAVGASIPDILRWLNPFKVGELYERAPDLVTFIVYEGTAMWTSAVNFIGAALFLAFLAWVALGLSRRRAGGAVLASLLMIAVALPSLGHAFEVRKGDAVNRNVTVPAGETIDDTLFAAGETVVIDGDVNGDLLAFGRSVTVRGNVAGDLITAGGNVSVEGSIGGSIIGGAGELSLLRARVGRNLYGFGNEVELDDAAEILGNVIAFGETVDIGGSVRRDFNGFGSRVTVSGTVDGAVEGFAGEVVLTPSARVGGNLTAHVDTAGDLNVQAGAVVGGTVNEQLREREQRRNRYVTVRFYVNQVLRLAGAFLTGLLLLWAFPALRAVTLPSVVAVLTSAGIGLAAAVTLPVAAVLVCFTIIGIPIAVLTFMLGAIGLYFSKAVVAQVIGRALFRGPNGPPHYAATLAAGLAIVIVAINLPWIGGFANLVLTLIGLGLIVTLLLGHFNRSATAA